MERIRTGFCFFLNVWFFLNPPPPQLASAPEHVPLGRRQWTAALACPRRINRLLWAITFRKNKKKQVKKK